ncbi:PQ-loop repeat-containing protein [Phanerochaete sordida]|uniref:PQ-loop repeat-containing protein n=1 Tax=Phanerochaete sordida TaxID=48140 RepID=A0A9P3GG40_9APHY|nr:PQ-loop repeat-containing protein [Phanerochaete sordida]
MLEDCFNPIHDVFMDVLTGGLCVGLVISYLPQHFRIILAKSSEGFSPWFLLLGSLSAASGMLNIVTMQWDIIRCCRAMTVGSCIEMTAGVFQLTLQWACFTFILVLYMIYYPPHKKYATVDLDSHDNRPPQHVKTGVKTDEWRLSIILAWVVLLYTLLVTFVTFLLLGIRPPHEVPRRIDRVDIWATFLGVTSTILAAFQYLPQIVHTYRHKLVGALSIPMMCIQTPGAILMVLSIALRPATNWTTWCPYAAAGILQGTLLVMCIIWKGRQKRLGIDDFGNPIVPSWTTNDPNPQLQDSPIPVTQGPAGNVPVQEAVSEAVQTDVRTPSPEPAPLDNAHEDTPLLKKDNTPDTASWTWFNWLVPKRH